MEAKRRHTQIRARVAKVVGFESMVSSNKVTVLHDGQQTFPAMLDAIEQARSEVLMEMYWFASDQTGRVFTEALARKAREGITVQLVYDAVGSFTTDGRMFAQLKDAGVQVEQYNPIAPWRARFRLGVLNRRNHRKLLVVDRNVGFTGGVNLADAWAPYDEGGGGWRDDTVRIEGPAVAQMRSIFEHTWAMLHGGRLALRSPLFAVHELPHDEGSGVRVLANHFFGERRTIRRAYLDRIRNAHTSICISNSYFVPDVTIARALYDAVERGVRVRVMVPGNSDVPAVHYAARRLYAEHLARGIEIYEWMGRMLHAKTAVIDTSWSTIGTYNLDYRSWRSNLEVTAEIDDAAFGSAMEARFDDDVRGARQLHLARWNERKFAERVVERICYMFRRVL